MNIRQIKDVPFDEVYDFYVGYTQSETLYKVLDEAQFKQNLIHDKCTLIATDQKVQGLISGVISKGTLYITLCYGTISTAKLLVEQFIDTYKDKTCTECAIHFFNPVSLPWYPKEGITHPCYQGVLLDSKMHELYQSLGFINHSIQETYYLDLQHYQKPDSKDMPKHIKIDVYDRQKHHKFDWFLNELKAPHWADILSKNQRLEIPLPVVVALDKDNVIGFAGPMKVEDLGRGYFAGIGLVSSYHKLHIGSQLFYTLCEYLKEMGAGYMTFYTGDTNPARFVYQKAGATVVQRFMTMKRSL